MLDFEKYNWQKHLNVYLVGVVWLDNSPLSIEELAGILTDKDFDFIQDFASKLTGHFTIVVEKEDACIIATDPVLRFPLFYTKQENAFIITDVPGKLYSSASANINDAAAKYFLHFGTCPGNCTLIENIHQLGPGTVTSLGITPLVSKRYSEMYFETKGAFEYSSSALATLLDSIFRKYIAEFKNRKIVLPLTAGYDSRLIAVMLKKHGIDDVLCFTWGRKGNIEEKTARKVAQHLGYKYQFIEYSQEMIQGFPRDETFLKYIHYSAHLSSMPYLQDYFAVKYLCDHRLIAPNSLFIPGQSGDMYAGSHLKTEYLDSSKVEIAHEIIQRFSFLGCKISMGCGEIEKLIMEHSPNFGSATEMLDYWDMSVRQAKFVVNSTSVFDFFGHDVAIPLSDQSFINYFLSAPAEHRIGEKLYRETLACEFFQPFGVGFQLKKSDSSKSELEIKRFLKSQMPYWLKQLYYSKNDPIFYHEATQLLIKDKLEKRKMIYPDNPRNYNAYIIQWYLKFLMNIDAKRLFI